MSELKSRLVCLSLFGCVLVLNACSTAGSSTSSGSTSQQASENGSLTLYEQLGGRTGVEKLSEQFIIHIAADKRIRERFAKSDIGRFHLMMQEHLCDISDGPCEYSGDDMQKTHGGMNIRSSEFNAVVEALMNAMDVVQLPISTQNRLLARLGPLRPEIVGH
ncbi:MAG: group 1 truncated hemoglobin [Granulosicoccus sp.]